MTPKYGVDVNTFKIIKDNKDGDRSDWSFRQKSQEVDHWNTIFPYTGKIYVTYVSSFKINSEFQIGYMFFKGISISVREMPICSYITIFYFYLKMIPKH